MHVLERIAIGSIIVRLLQDDCTIQLLLGKSLYIHVKCPIKLVVVVSKDESAIAK